jgi:hypothetical protein
MGGEIAESDEVELSVVLQQIEIIKKDLAEVKG